MEMSFSTALLGGALYDSALALTLCRVRPNLAVLCSITLTSADWPLRIKGDITFKVFCSQLISMTLSKLEPYR